MLWYARSVDRTARVRENVTMKTIRATYQNGVFTPEQPIELPDGSQVTLWVEPPGTEVSQLRPEDREFLDRLATDRKEVFRRLAE